MEGGHARYLTDLRYLHARIVHTEDDIRTDGERDGLLLIGSALQRNMKKDKI